MGQCRAASALSQTVVIFANISTSLRKFKCHRLEVSSVSEDKKSYFTFPNMVSVRGGNMKIWRCINKIIAGPIGDGWKVGTVHLDVASDPGSKEIKREYCKFLATQKREGDTGRRQCLPKARPAAFTGDPRHWNKSGVNALISHGPCPRAFLSASPCLITMQRIEQASGVLFI